MRILKTLNSLAEKNLEEQIKNLYPYVSAELPWVTAGKNYGKIFIVACWIWKYVKYNFGKTQTEVEPFLCIFGDVFWT